MDDITTELRKYDLNKFSYHGYPVARFISSQPQTHHMCSPDNVTEEPTVTRDYGVSSINRSRVQENGDVTRNINDEQSNSIMRQGNGIYQREIGYQAFDTFRKRTVRSENNGDCEERQLISVTDPDFGSGPVCTSQTHHVYMASGSTSRLFASYRSARLYRSWEDHTSVCKGTNNWTQGKVSKLLIITAWEICRNTSQLQDLNFLWWIRTAVPTGQLLTTNTYRWPLRYGPCTHPYTSHDATAAKASRFSLSKFLCHSIKPFKSLANLSTSLPTKALNFPSSCGLQ